MHVVVVGCGRVGSELAGTLEKSGHTVSVIDKNPNAFRRLPAGYAGQKVIGFGFDRDNLLEAGIERAGAVAAVTNGDNSNILVARIARETFGIERVVARIYDPRRAVMLNEPGRFWLTAVTRLGSAQIATANVVGQEGDVLHFMVDVNAIDALRERLENGPGH